MASYTEKSIAAYQKAVTDAVAGKGLAKTIRQLQERSQVRDSLKDKTGKTIPAKPGVGKRTVGGRTVTAYTEVAGTRAFWGTTRELRSSDGLLVLQYSNLKTLTMMDSVSNLVVFSYVDYVPA